MTELKKPNKKDILEAIDKLEKNPSARTKILGEMGVAGMGAAGVGALAAFFGASVAPIPIVTALTGFGMVVAAPVTLVAGAAIAGGAAAYGLTKLATSGAYDKGKQEEIKQKLKDRLKEFEVEEQKTKLTEENKNAFIIFLKEPLQLDLITAEQAQELIELIENGQMTLEEAYGLLNSIIEETGNTKKS
ncbi:hypothetical protein H6F75_24610 [Nodosilinea sp. FACHB-131]|uniref:hypothetical protein n=1 Tax=Cyanophyceae TaxID=3028117 RepID=UPI001688FE77|nr:hypothetical protein [Nodosilinea sp. FACHB-131]MBD1876674.1 hypothetical protein [Nodosilinea sp. FACHB-131]